MQQEEVIVPQGAQTRARVFTSEELKSSTVTEDNERSPPVKHQQALHCVSASGAKLFRYLAVLHDSSSGVGAHHSL